MDSTLNSPVYVIHLAKAVERRQQFMTNISNASFTDINIFDGIDGTDLDRVIECKQILGNNVIFDWEPSAGQIGCLLSHLMLWKHIIDNNIPLATVFEDDVHFHPQWKELSEQYWNETPKDFDNLFIGNSLDSCLLNSPSNKINTESTYCTHAYIITNNGAKDMLNAMLNWDYKDFCHVTRGNTLSGLYPIDIMIKDIQNKVLSGKIPSQFIWYCWNGTHYPCDNNRLPVKGNDFRNTGLVFQNTDKQLVSYIKSAYKKNVFMDENGNEFDITKYEVTEQWIAETFIEEDAIVLELGGRYGVVSSVINKKLKKKKNHVVIEPDPAIFKVLQRNLLLNDADPICYNGTITKRPQYIEILGTGTNTRYQPCACDSDIVHHKSLTDLIQETGLQFDTLVADCEGCLGVFFEENLEYISNFKMITTMKYDYGHEIDYDKINKILVDFGFNQVRPGGHSVWKKPSSEISHKTDTSVSQLHTNPPVVTRQKLIWNRNNFNLKYIN